MAGWLCEHYGWPPDFWRRKPPPQHSMGWLELHGWLRERRRSIELRLQGMRANPNSWAGSEHDPFWVEARARRAARR